MIMPPRLRVRIGARPRDPFKRGEATCVKSQLFFVLARRHNLWLLKIILNRFCDQWPPPQPHGTIIKIDMSKLTKRDIVVSISNQTGMVQHQVFDVVQRTLDKITDSLANNIPVELRNFGVFQPRLTKPRVGRNPNQPGQQFCDPAARDSEIQGWQNHASAR